MRKLLACLVLPLVVVFAALTPLSARACFHAGFGLTPSFAFATGAQACPVAVAPAYAPAVASVVVPAPASVIAVPFAASFGAAGYGASFGAAVPFFSRAVVLRQRFITPFAVVKGRRAAVVVGGRRGAVIVRGKGVRGKGVVRGRRRR